MSGMRSSGEHPGGEASGGETKGVCPLCGAPRSREARPFCSKRCADIDLHRWLGGHYRVPVVEEDGGDTDEADEE